MLQASTVRFLKELKKNNSKSWFDENRSTYEKAKKDYEQFVQSLIDKFAKSDSSIANLKAKECMFRINRDIRFSKDKSPYKTNFGASVNPGGKKSLLAGYYLHVEPGGSFVGGGIWSPMPAELSKVRQEIDYNFDEFKKIISSKKFTAVYGELYNGNDISLARVPKGYEADNPAAPFLKLKSVIAMKPISDKELQSPDLLSISSSAFQSLQPLIQFLNRALAV
jgi:uncharacterized protein (TIGR02453 family)